MLRAVQRDLNTGEYDIDRIAWFWPTFHLECGAVLRRDGPLQLHTRVQSEGSPRYPWLLPIWSCEPVALAQGEHTHLTALFDAAADTSATDMCIDGCIYEIIVAKGAVVATRGNPPRGEVAVLARALVDLARSHARWRSTHTGFFGLEGYLCG